MQAIVNRPRRGQRTATRGQAMAIFALMAVFLFAVTGLAVDAGLSYLTDNGTERAAAAGALAGVPYMPQGFVDQSAQKAALSAVARNGFANGSTRNGHSVTVTVAQYPSGCGSAQNPCDANKLTVSVKAWVQTTFLHILGFGDHPVVATDTAYYLPPISLGQPGNQLGSRETDLGNSGSFYFLRSEGYGNPRSEGDAFDPNNVNQTFTCGNSVSETTAGQGTSQDQHLLSKNRGNEVADSSMSGSGFNLLPKRGGYDYAITVPSTQSRAAVQVYNPAFAPDSGYTTNNRSSNYNMHEQDTSFSGNTYQDQYSAMEYTLFSVADIFDHTRDTPISQFIIDPINAPSDGNTANFKDAYTGATVKAATITKVYHQWMDVGNQPSLSYRFSGNNYSLYNGTPISITSNSSYSNGWLTPGNYRLRVDMLDYQGLRPGEDNNASPCGRAHKGYAVQLAVPDANGNEVACVDSGCNLSALGEMAIYTPIANAGAFNIPVFSMSKYYQGKTVDVFVYDPGDVGGTNTLSFINPDTCNPLVADAGKTVDVHDLGVSQSGAPTTANLVQNQYSGYSPPVQASPYTTATINTVTGPGGGGASNVFNGHWLLFALPIPANYAGGTGNCAGGVGNYWQLQYSVSGGTATDTITIAVAFAGSPVHLI